METDEIIVENEPLIYEENNLETVSSVEISVLEDVDISQPAFIGFGIAAAMCLISITIASVIKVFRRAG